MIEDPDTTRVPELDLTQPRPVTEIVATAVRLYRAEGWAFLRLTAVVVLPYEVIALLVINFASSNHSRSSIGAFLLLVLGDIALLVPIVSALLMQAVVGLAEGERPRVTRIFRRALSVLPHVTAAVIIVALGVVLGLFFFIVPGILLALRWAVVAQTAAFEGTDWPTSLRRGANLTQGNYMRILGLSILMAGIDLILQLVVGAVSGAGAAAGDVASVLASLLMSSFGALCLALLYFDLRTREEGGHRSPTMIG